MFNYKNVEEAEKEIKSAFKNYRKNRDFINKIYPEKILELETKLTNIKSPNTSGIRLENAISNESSRRSALNDEINKLNTKKIAAKNEMKYAEILLVQVRDREDIDLKEIFIDQYFEGDKPSDYMWRAEYYNVSDTAFYKMINKEIKRLAKNTVEIETIINEEDAHNDIVRRKHFLGIYRKMIGYNQSELAKKLGISSSTINRTEDMGPKNINYLSETYFKLLEEKSETDESLLLPTLRSTHKNG